MTDKIYVLVDESEFLEDGFKIIKASKNRKTLMEWVSKEYPEYAYDKDSQDYVKKERTEHFTLMSWLCVYEVEMI